MRPLNGAASSVGTTPVIVWTPQARAQTLPWLSVMLPPAPAAPLRYHVAMPALLVLGPESRVQPPAGEEQSPLLFLQPQAVTYSLSSAETWAMPWSNIWRCVDLAPPVRAVTETPRTAVTMTEPISMATMTSTSEKPEEPARRRRRVMGRAISLVRRGRSPSPDRDQARRRDGVGPRVVRCVGGRRANRVRRLPDGAAAAPAAADGVARVERVRAVPPVLVGQVFAGHEAAG